MFPRAENLVDSLLGNPRPPKAMQHIFLFCCRGGVEAGDSENIVPVSWHQHKRQFHLRFVLSRHFAEYQSSEHTARNFANL